MFEEYEGDFWRGHGRENTPPIPEKVFELRGKVYHFTGHSFWFEKGPNEGTCFHLVRETQQKGGLDDLFWVSEQIPGEFIQVLIPRSMSKEPFIVYRT